MNTSKQPISSEKESFDNQKNKNSEKSGNENVRKLLVMGLEGSGKTSLINNLCDKDYDTGSNKDGYKIDKEQKGVFDSTSPPLNITLYDTNGLKVNEPGKWHENLKSTLEINGVIFFIDGHDERYSLHGDLPRLIDYCRKLELPRLYLFRTNLVTWLDDEKVTSESESLVNAETVIGENDKKKAIYSDVDKTRLKNFIAKKFEQASGTKALIDPVQLAIKIRDLKNLHEQEMRASIEKYQQMERLYEETKKNLEDLKLNLTASQGLCQEITNKNVEMTNRMKRLQLDIKKLESIKENALKNIQNTMNYLRTRVNEVAVQDGRDRERIHVRSKKHTLSKGLTLLPFAGIFISNDYDTFAEKVAELMNEIVHKLEEPYEP